MADVIVTTAWGYDGDCPECYKHHRFFVKTDAAPYVFHLECFNCRRELHMVRNDDGPKMIRLEEVDG